jgi:predicted DNA-binding ribbon-helix-helix protein
MYPLYQFSLARRVLRGMLLAGVFLVVFGTVNFKSVRAEEGIPQKFPPSLKIIDPGEIKESAVCPSSIGFGETAQCSILSGEMDTYTFTASAGDTVLVRMSESTSGLYPRLRVYNPGGIKICESSYDTTTAEIASCALASDGTYTIQAFDYYETNPGDYYIHLQRLNNPGGAAAIGFGQTLIGSLITPAQMNAYTFTASAGDKVLVRMSESAGNIYPNVRVYSPQGTQLCESSYNTTTAEIPSCALTSGGVYTILAFDYYGTYTGNYYIYLQRLNNAGNATAISFGQALFGSLITTAQMDTYTFTASAGDKVLVRMSESAGNFYPEVRVYNPQGTKLCESGYNTTTAEIPSCALTSDGTYTILAFDYYGTYTGDYHVYLQRLNNPGNAALTDFGQTSFGSLITTAQMDTYTFTASAGDKVLVRMSESAGSIYPDIRVYNPQGTQLCESGYSSTNAEISSCALTGGDGIYTILAFDYYGTNTGDYHIHLQRLNNPGAATSISFGQALFGSLLTTAEMDAYTFTASAGDKILVRASESAGNFYPEVRVYSPQGTQLCESGFSSTTAEIPSCALTSDGVYTILAFDYYGTYTGDYHIYLQRLNNPGNAALTDFGQTTFGSLITTAQMDTYTFTASAGDKVLIRMSESAGSIYPDVRVYSPQGTQLCESGYNSTTAEIASCALTSDGTYTILAFDYYGTNTGDYYIHLQRLNNPGGARTIGFGQTLSGSLLTTAEMDAYTFAASAGDKVLVRMTKLAGSIYPDVWVFSPQGVLLCESGYSSTSAEIATCALTSDGTYTILAFDYYGTYAGTYSIYLQRLNYPGTPVPIQSNAAQDGWILESGENSSIGGAMNSSATTFRLGDDAARKQYRSILSFSTGNIPDTAIITKMTLKVRSQGIVGGGNPVTMFQGFMLDIRKGTFGTAPLQATDWQATAQKTIGPLTIAPVSGWYTFNLTSIRGYINKLSTAGGLTQIRLRFKLDSNNNTVANYLNLFSGETAAASRPLLIIQYYVP